MNVPELVWRYPSPVEIPQDLAEVVDAFGGHPIISQALIQRGYLTPQSARAFLDADQYHPTEPDELPGLAAACERLWRAIQNGEWIGVWGDFDVDGQTATAILVGVLQELGGKVCYHIPNRDKESHGVRLEYLRAFAGSGISQEEPLPAGRISACPGRLKILLTCDTGITAHDAANWCRDNGIDMIITDHHSLPSTLPNAHTIVSPHLLPAEHPLSFLCGAGISYKVAEKLGSMAGQPALAEKYQDLAAIGTVADVAELRADNRWLVQKGLLKLRENKRPALRSMLKLAETNPDYLTEEHIGYLLAPRLNAIGRLDDANAMVPFLLSQDERETDITALRLEGLNNQRKFLCSSVLAGCLAKIAASPELNTLSALVLDHPEWHPGVLGIVASRLVELFHKPVLLIQADQGITGRGSARSIPGVNIIEAIGACADLLTGFGGHPMAAGISLPYENIPAFRRALHQAIRQQVGEEFPSPELAIDAQLTLPEINLNFVEKLEYLAPFGNGNPPLVFVTPNLSLQSSVKIGKQEEHLQLAVEDQAGNTIKVLWWNGIESSIPEGRFDLAYTLRASNFKGSRQVQVEWQAARPRPEAEVIAGTAPLQIFDFRHALNPHSVLETVLQSSSSEVIVWREGISQKKLNGCTRSQLRPSPTLAIWTIPPANSILQSALQTVHPNCVYLFGIQPGVDQAGPFLKNLAGLIQYALNHFDGWVDPAELAEKCGYTVVTIEKGIDWLIHNGSIRVVQKENRKVRLQKGGISDPARKQQIEKELRLLLEETAAYRSYYLRADENDLIRLTTQKPKI